MRAGEEFYVGYGPSAPAGVASFVRRTILVVLPLVTLLAISIIASHGPFGPGVFEYGKRRAFSGTIVERPYPLLLVPRPGRSIGAPLLSSYLLVAPGKFGAGPLVTGLDGQAVRLSGPLAFREGRTMIEIEPGSIEPLAHTASSATSSPSPGSSAPSPAALAASAATIGGLFSDDPLEVRTLHGEIVDSKCYLGVMNPGERKTHKACAIRCISGGSPPFFVVRSPSGESIQFLLVSPTGKAVNRDVLGMVGEPLEIRGTIFHAGGQFILRADPATFRAVN